jgi:uroporphyrinogen decarboxylase
MLDDLRSDPRHVLPALESIASALAGFASTSMAAGAAGVFYAITGYGSADVMSLTEYQELLLPLDRKVLDACSDCRFNMLHLCGPRQHFELARSLPAACVNWQLQDEGNPTLSEGRRLSGRAVVGGLHRRTPIADGTPEQVLEQAEAALRDAGRRGFLLTPGCSVSPWPRDREENFRAMLGAVE